MPTWILKHYASVVISIIALLACCGTHASESVLQPKTPPSETPANLQPMVVVASKAPRPIQDVAGTVHVITAEDRQRLVAQDLDQLLRYQPAINVQRSGTRFGATGINIRGIGGNRVAVEIDGIPMRQQFTVGSFANAGRDLLESNLIRRIEILNGPASTLYGSNAIGGVVAITTWDAHSLLQGSSQNWYADISAAYHGEDNSKVASVIAATEQSGQSGLGIVAAATRRSGRQLGNQADSRFEDDIQDRDSINGHLRLDWQQANGNQLRLLFNHFDRQTDTRIQSLLGLGRFRSTTALLADDQDDQTSVSLAYQFGSVPGFDSGQILTYFQTADTFQQTSETRALANAPLQLQRDFRYQFETAGAELNLARRFTVGISEHQLGLGLEYRYSRSSELRDGSQTVLGSGVTSNQVLGEIFPVRDFPISDVMEWGLYLHDEIRFGDSRWLLIPGLRIDHYALQPRPDAIYREDNPFTETVSLSTLAASPKLGLVYQFNDSWSGFAQYARGFRAPPFEDANIGLDIPLFGIRAIPNPDLQSETSDGFELGVRHWGRHGQFSLSGFLTDYNDFIETRARIGIDPETGVLLFQSRNIEQARIYGAELSWSQALEAWHPGLQGLRLELAGYWSRGDNQSNDQPLNSIAPPQAVVGLQWQSSDDRWYTGLTNTFTRRQTRIDQTSGARFATPGYGVLDWVWGWRANEWLQLRGGVFNVTDKQYWRWLDVAAFTPDDPVIQILSRPGRHLALNLSINL